MNGPLYLLFHFESCLLPRDKSPCIYIYIEIMQSVAMVDSYEMLTTASSSSLLLLGKATNRTGQGRAGQGF